MSHGVPRILGNLIVHGDEFRELGWTSGVEMEIWFLNLCTPYISMSECAKNPNRFRFWTKTQTYQTYIFRWASYVLKKSPMRTIFRCPISAFPGHSLHSEAGGSGHGQWKGSGQVPGGRRDALEQPWPWEIHVRFFRPWLIARWVTRNMFMYIMYVCMYRSISIIIILLVLFFYYYCYYY